MLKENNKIWRFRSARWSIEISARENFSMLLSALLCSNLQYFVVAWLITPVALLSKAHKEFPIALREENSGALVTSDRGGRSIPFISLSLFFFYSQASAANIKNFKYDFPFWRQLNRNRNWKCLFLFRSLYSFVLFRRFHVILYYMFSSQSAKRAKQIFF